MIFANCAKLVFGCFKNENSFILNFFFDQSTFNGAFLTVLNFSGKECKEDSHISCVFWYEQEEGKYVLHL